MGREHGSGARESNGSEGRLEAGAERVGFERELRERREALMRKVFDLEERFESELTYLGECVGKESDVSKVTYELAKVRGELVHLALSSAGIGIDEYKAYVASRLEV